MHVFCGLLRPGLRPILTQIKREDIGEQTLGDLQNLEKELETGLCRVLARKVSVIYFR